MRGEGGEEWERGREGMWVMRVSAGEGEGRHVGYES